MNEPIPIHQWTHDGDAVLIVKCVAKDGTSYGGFQWPLAVGAEVVAPDWSPEPECGGGLHGWPWGLSMGDGKEPEWDGAWLVFAAAVQDVVSLSGKVKAKCGRVVFVGRWWEATDYVLSGQMAWVHHAASGAASATGERGAASATGWSGAASATGDASLAGVTGLGGRARCGAYGVLALAINISGRIEMRCARVGCGDGSDGLLLADVWYTLNESGEFVEGA